MEAKNAGDLVVNVDVLISAPVHVVWDCLTNPSAIKQYLFGTEVETDWKVGSPITWKGSWQGKDYEDKGTIVNIVPGKLLETTYWSSMSGVDDIPSNYKKVTYQLEEDGDNTRLFLTQDNVTSLEEKSHSEQNWKTVLDGLKKLVEK